MSRLLLAVAIGLSFGSCQSAEVSVEVEVQVNAVALDPSSHSPVVILKELEGRRRLPIWIGMSEARSIAAELENEDPVRPNTHDLAKRLIDRLDGTVDHVVITELSEGIYYAMLVVRSGGRTVSVDARPSDAIAIGLRTGAPLFVREALFESSLDAVTSGKGQEVRWQPSRRSDDRQFHLPSL